MSLLIEWVGEAYLVLVAGFVIGLAFGLFAQQSRFCLRSATIEFWQGRPGSKFAIWLLAFSAALLSTQILILAGWLDPGSIRQLTGTGSLSGAIIGGAMFGTGMILARGCASRLLILSATGNMRALVSGLVLTFAAQASLRGVLSPLREGISALWTVSGEARSLLAYLPLNPALPLSVALILAAILLGRRSGLKPWQAMAATGVGLSIGAGWGLTSWLASWSFEVVPVQSVTFTGPSADTLMALVNSPVIPANFGVGLVPGVFLGSFLASVATREFAWQAFDASTGMMRYLAGAVLMGFGGMLAGGCAVGAGVTGGAVLATTAWAALLAMWLSAGMASRLIDGAPAPGSTVNSGAANAAGSPAP